MRGWDELDLRKRDSEKKKRKERGRKGGREGREGGILNAGERERENGEGTHAAAQCALRYAATADLSPSLGSSQQRNLIPALLSK